MKQALDLLHFVQQPLTDLPNVNQIYAITDEKYLGKIMAFYLKKLQTLNREFQNISNEFIAFCIQHQYQHAISILTKHGYYNDDLVAYTGKMSGKYQMKVIGYLLLLIPNQEYLQFMFINLNKPWKYTTAKILALYYQKSAINLNELRSFMQDYQYTQGILLLFSEFIKLNLINIPNDMLYEYLHLDKRIGTASIGQGIRDFTCFVFWRKTRHTLIEDPNLLALHLILVCCFDPIHHVRRASSAVFMELVGRSTIKHGLLLLPHLDYYTIGNSNRAHLVGSRIALIDPYFQKAIIYYLLQIIQTTMDTDLLMNRCQVLATIIKYCDPCTGRSPIKLHNNKNPLFNFSVDIDCSLPFISNCLSSLFNGDYFQVQAACYLTYNLFVSSQITNSSYDLSFGQLDDKDEQSKTQFVHQQHLPSYPLTPISCNLSLIHKMANSAYSKLRGLLDQHQFEFILQIKCMCLLMVALSPDPPMLDDLYKILFNKAFQNSNFSIYDEHEYNYPNEIKLICVDALLRYDDTVFDKMVEILKLTNRDDHVTMIITYFTKCKWTIAKTDTIINELYVKYASILTNIGQIRSKILNLFAMLLTAQMDDKMVEFLLSICRDALVDYTNEQKGDTGSFVRQSACLLFGKIVATNGFVGVEVMRECTSHVIYASYANIDKLRIAAEACLVEIGKNDKLGLNVPEMQGIYKISHTSGMIHTLNGNDHGRITEILNKLKLVSSGDFIQLFIKFKRRECKINQIFVAGCILVESGLFMEEEMMAYLYGLFVKLTKNKSIAIICQAVQNVIKLVFMDIRGFMEILVGLLDNVPRVRTICVEQLYNIYSIMPEYYNEDVGDMLMGIEWHTVGKEELKRNQERLKLAISK